MSQKTENRQPTGLYKNAIESIQLGIEDYQANQPKRAVSAVRNFYAGVLLLAKEVLVRRAPEARPEDVISARFKPVPNGAGNVKFEPVSQNTIDFSTIGERFKDFGLPIDQSALKDLSRIRNDLEHRYSDQPHGAVREAIAKAFPVVADLFRLAGEFPKDALGDTWQVMLDVRDVYDRELSACRGTFDKVEWRNSLLDDPKFECPECGSDLVEQGDPENTSHEAMECRCRLCGESFAAETAIEGALERHFDAESYIAMTDGGDQPVQTCPECGADAYILSEEYVGCAWCGVQLEECGRCCVGLTPENVDPDNSSLCSYCGHLMSKDD